MKKAKVLFLGLTILSSICVLSGCDSSNENNNEITENGNETIDENLRFHINEDNTGYIVGDCRQVTGSVEIPASYNSLPVVGISERAFDKAKMTSIKLPNTLTFIKDYAFTDCTSLESIEIPNSVTSIGCYVFLGCTSLKSVNIPKNVTKIEKATFQECTSLKSIEIPSIITSIGEQAFTNCTSLESIEIPDSVTSVGRSAFSGCFSAKTLKISKNITKIEDATFSGCSSIRKIVIPEGVTSIGLAAFDCSSLISLTLPASLKNVDRSFYYSTEGKFMEIYNLSELTSKEVSLLWVSDDPNVLSYKVIHSSLDEKSVLSEDENGYTLACYNNRWYLVDYNGSKKELVLPEKYVLDGNEIQTYEIIKSALHEVKSVKLPNSMTSIGENAFSSCVSLESIELSNSITSIGDYSFTGCKSLVKIDIPSAVTSIGWETFCGCEKLNTINFAGTNDDWSNINFGFKWNEGIPATKVTCSDGEVNL